jgi:plasmid stabilization system protein ParE
MKPLIYHPGVRREVKEAAAYYRSQQPGLERRFIEQLDRAYKKIRHNPWTGFSSAQETRTLSLRYFRHGVVFKEYVDHIFIFAVCHYSREPDYWLERLEDHK